MTMECRVEFDYEAQESDELNLTKGDIITNVVTKMDGWWEGTLSTTGQRGMFPDNFVKVVTSHSNSSADESQGTEKVQMRQKAGPSARRLKAMFSYTPEQEDELSLEVGDVVDFIAEVEEGWWRGQLKGRTGIFPSNFVAEFEPATSTSSTAINGKLVTPETSKNELTKHNEKHRISSNSKIPPDVIPAEKPTEIKVEDEPAPKLPPKPVRETARCFYPYPAQNEDELNLEEGDIVLIISKECEDEGWWRGELRGKVGLFPDNFVQIISTNDISSGKSQQPTPNNVTATERSSDDVTFINEVRQDLPSPDSGTSQTSITTSVIDGGGNSKVFIDKDKEKPLVTTTKDDSTPAKRSSFLINRSKDLTALSKHKAQAPLASPTFLTNQKSVEAKTENAMDGVDPVVDFNDVERGEKLVHLTANRAKAPRRRPPSTGPKENENGILNGSTTNSFEETTVDNNASPTSYGPNTPFQDLKSINANSAIAITSPVSTMNESYSRKDISQSQTAHPHNPAAPTQKAPWLAELRHKQNKKQSPSSVSLSSTSPTPASSSPASASPATVFKEKGAPPAVPVTAARPPALPAKPVLTQVSPASTYDRASTNSPTSPNLPNLPTPNTTIPVTAHIASTPSSNNLSNATSKFVGHRRLNVTTISTNSTPTTGNGSTGDAPASSQSINSVRNSVVAEAPKLEWVPYEEHAKLRDRVTVLEAEAEIMKKQLKLLIERTSKGHIV